jgi:hypothetical protein
MRSRNVVNFRPTTKPRQPTLSKKEVVKLAKATLSLLDGASEGSEKSRKTSKKAKEAKGKSKIADGATKVPKDPMRATFQANLEKTKIAAKDAKGAMTAAAS